MERKEADREKEARSAPDRQHGADQESSASKAESDPVASLHRAVGNRAVQRLYENGDLQPKLTVSQPDDPAEREAERVAEQVVRASDRNVTGAAAPGDPADIVGPETGATPDLYRRSAAEIGRLRPGERSGDSSPGRNTDPGLENRIRALRGGGRSLPRDVRSEFEATMGYDFGDVRVHTGTEADTVARSLDAEAFTVGSDVAFREGAYDPGSRDGRRLLAHELTHVVQAGASEIRRQEASGGRQQTGQGGTSPSAGRGEDRESLSGGQGGSVQPAVNRFLNRHDDPDLGYRGKAWASDTFGTFRLPPEQDQKLVESIEKTGRDVWQKMSPLRAGYDAHPSTDSNKSASELFTNDVILALAGTEPPPIPAYQAQIRSKLEGVETLLGQEPRRYGGVTLLQEAIDLYNRAAEEWNSFTEAVIGTASATVTTLKAVETGSAITVGVGLTVAGVPGAGLWAAGLKTSQKIGKETTEHVIGLEKEFTWADVGEIGITALKEFAFAYLGGKLNGFISGRIASAGEAELVEQFGAQAASALRPMSKEVIAGLVADISETLLSKFVETGVKHLWNEFQGTSGRETGETFLKKLADAIFDLKTFAELVGKKATRAGSEASGGSYVSP